VNAPASLLTCPATRAPASPRPGRATALLAVLALAGTVFAMMQALVIPALPRIQASLGTNADGAAWISTAYLLSACILTPVIGRLGEIAGKRRMMLASLITFAAGTLVCAVAGNLGELVAGRVMQGAAGGIYPLAFAIIRDRLPRERVPGGIGLVSSLLAIGGGLGLVLPGPIMTRLSGGGDYRVLRPRRQRRPGRVRLGRRPDPVFGGHLRRRLRSLRHPAQKPPLTRRSYQAKRLAVMDSRLVRTWRSGFPERHVRTNSIRARDAGIYLEIGHPAECRHPHAQQAKKFMNHVVVLPWRMNYGSLPP
jgi:hypothetical protein